jgi:hypothetical protein
VAAAAQGITQLVGVVKLQLSSEQRQLLLLEKVAWILVLLLQLLLQCWAKTHRAGAGQWFQLLLQEWQQQQQNSTSSVLKTPPA